MVATFDSNESEDGDLILNKWPMILIVLALLEAKETIKLRIVIVCKFVLIVSMKRRANLVFK